MTQRVFRLVFIEGGTPGEIVNLDKDELTIGRENTADIVIPSPAVSAAYPLTDLWNKC